MDKYLAVVLSFMIVGIPISFVSPNTGAIYEEPILPLFYGSIAGIIIIIAYSTRRDRRKRREANAKRRSRK